MFKYLMLLFVTKNTSYDKICMFSVNAFCLILSLSIYKITKQIRISFLIFFISILVLNFLFYYQATQIQNSDKITKKRYDEIKEINDWVINHIINNNLKEYIKEISFKNLKSSGQFFNSSNDENEKVVNIFSKIKGIKFEEIKNIEEFWGIKFFVFYNENQNAKQVECISTCNSIDYQFQGYLDFLEFNISKIIINSFNEEILKIVKENNISYEVFLKEMRQLVSNNFKIDEIKFFKSLIVKKSDYYCVSQKFRKAIYAMKNYDIYEKSNNFFVSFCLLEWLYDTIPENYKNKIKNEFNTWKAS